LDLELNFHLSPLDVLVLPSNPSYTLRTLFINDMYEEFTTQEMGKWRNGEMATRTEFLSVVAG